MKTILKTIWDKIAYVVLFALGALFYKLALDKPETNVVIKKQKQKNIEGNDNDQDVNVVVENTKKKKAFLGIRLRKKKKAL